MSDNLRDLASRRYRESERRTMYLDLWRRLAVAFLFGLGLALAAIMSARAVIQRAFGPQEQQIERGLGDGDHGNT